MSEHQDHQAILAAEQGEIALLLLLLQRQTHFQGIIMATLADFTTALNGVNDQLQKALAEIQAEIANIGQSTPAMDAALARLQAAAQALDDLNPDAPAA